MRFTRPRGTNDFFGDRMERWRAIEELLARVLRSCGYAEIRTPIFEATELFTRTVGEGTDIVSKEMYTFTDKKGRSMTLRPENTAPVMRAYLENGLSRGGGISRFYYMGPMFRYDRPQAGRYRQFHQIGAEAIGSAGPAIDAEIIDVSLALYRALGFPELDVRLNSVGCPVCRPAYKRALTASLATMKENLCDTCVERSDVNPLRVFDCKECSSIKDRLPRITEHLCAECDGHFGELQRILDAMGVRVTLDPTLVRGLDYYTKTAYEVLHPGLGAQNALCGGGRYDGLAQDCGGPYIPAVGFSAGVERLIETMPEGAVPAGVGAAEAVVIVLDRSANALALSLGRTLREGGVGAAVDLTERSLKKQLKAAADSGASFAVIVGLEEASPGSVAVKDLGTGTQRIVPAAEAAGAIREGRERRDG